MIHLLSQPLIVQSNPLEVYLNCAPPKASLSDQLLVNRNLLQLKGPSGAPRPHRWRMLVDELVLSLGGCAASDASQIVPLLAPHVRTLSAIWFSCRVAGRLEENVQPNRLLAHL